MFHGVFEPSFPLSCFASARPCLVSRLCEAVFSLIEILLHKSRSVVKFCDIFSIHCFQLARVVSVCLFFLCPVEVFVHTSHMMSQRTWFRALDQFVCFSCATCLLDSANQKHVSSCLISAIFSEHHKCHPAHRYFHSGSGAARSAALFFWSLRDVSSHG